MEALRRAQPAGQGGDRSNHGGKGQDEDGVRERLPAGRDAQPDQDQVEAIPSPSQEIVPRLTASSVALGRNSMKLPS